ILEVAVARERPQREEFRVAVIAQVEHAREARRRVVRLAPEAVVALRAGQIVDPALDRGMVDLPRRHQAEHGPSRLRRRARRSLVAAVIELIARAILAPAAVAILDPDEPRYGPADFGRGMVDASGIQRAQNRPGAIDVIHAPAAIPASLFHLR